MVTSAHPLPRGEHRPHLGYQNVVSRTVTHPLSAGKATGGASHGTNTGTGVEPTTVNDTHLT